MYKCRVMEDVNMYNDILAMVKSIHNEQADAYDKFLMEEFLKRGYTLDMLKDTDNIVMERPGRDGDETIYTYIVDNVPVLTMRKRTTLINDPEHYTYKVRFEFEVLEGEN